MDRRGEGTEFEVASESEPMHCLLRGNDELTVEVAARHIRTGLKLTSALVKNVEVKCDSALTVEIRGRLSDEEHLDQLGDLRWSCDLQ